MPTDVLMLGPFEFTDFAVPERLPFGGRQKLTVHRLPGGMRVIDAMGPDEVDRQWSGTLWGDNAMGDALTLDALRKAGEPLPYSNGVESLTVVILEFLPKVRKMTCVEYDITVVVAEAGGGGGGGGIGGLVGLGAQVLGDIGSALGILG